MIYPKRHATAPTTGPDTSHAAVVASCTCGWVRVSDSIVDATRAAEVHQLLHRTIARRDAGATARPPHAFGVLPGRTPGRVRAPQGFCEPHTSLVRRK
jgi:hypothetical protein